ncbi:Transcription initiation factor TFIID subunit 7 [Glycine max]|nr:Transcription initiation factor TFIID subunit 7 [Glycine max]
MIKLKSQFIFALSAQSRKPSFSFVFLTLSPPPHTVVSHQTCNCTAEPANELGFVTITIKEQFILRVPPNVAERIERLLNENNASSSEDKSLDLSFREDGRSGTFMIGNEQFPASLLDLPCVVESYKTYDDNSLIKTANIGQMIMVRESGDAAPDVIEYRHGLTPPMRDARKRRFRREPDLNPELVSPEQEEGDENARGANKKSAPKPAPKHDIPENLTNAGEADRSDSEESDDSV